MSRSKSTDSNTQRPEPVVFLSYSRADVDAVTRVRDLLHQRGIRTRLDSADFPLGLPWISTIEGFIQEVDAVLAFLGAERSGTRPGSGNSTRAGPISEAQK